MSPGASHVEQLRNLLKEYKITSFYMALPPALKRQFLRSARHLGEGLVPATSSAALWTTAANATPRKYHRLARGLLHEALSRAHRSEDLAWSHAHLAQLYVEMAPEDPRSRRLAAQHCRQILRTDHLNAWAKAKLRELGCEGETPNESEIR